jgi:2-polyprenyl-3-methyl-5-hydroxy-6-metoxy-1,4-benzoquinol methylase
VAASQRSTDWPSLTQLTLGGEAISRPVIRKERYWSRYARTYDESAEYVVGKTLRQAIIKKLLEERDLGEVIEFGCGTGYFTKAVAKNAKRVVATDLSEEMLEMAKQQLKEFLNVTIEKADCEERSFPLESFDTVFMANTCYWKSAKSASTKLSDFKIWRVVAYCFVYGLQHELL